MNKICSCSSIKHCLYFNNPIDFHWNGKMLCNSILCHFQKGSHTMYIPRLCGWKNGVIFFQPCRKSSTSWVMLTNCIDGDFAPCISDPCPLVRARLAPWLSEFSGVASIAATCPSLLGWYGVWGGQLLVGSLISLWHGKSHASPFFLHLKQRPPALCLQYSSAESQSSSIALGSLPMTPVSWVHCVPGWYSTCVTGLLSGFWLVIQSPWFCFLKENNKSSVEIVAVCRSSRVAYVSLKSSHCISFFRLCQYSHGRAGLLFIPARSAVLLNFCVWSLHEAFCLISTRCHCILWVSVWQKVSARWW